MRVRRVDFNATVTLDSLMAAMATTGFQATNLGLAVEEVNRMVRCFPSFRPVGLGSKRACCAMSL